MRMPFRKHFCPRLRHKNAVGYNKKAEVILLCEAFLPLFPAFWWVNLQKRCPLSTVKHRGGSIIALAAISWDSLGLTITPHRCVMAKVYETILQDDCSGSGSSGSSVFCSGFFHELNQIPGMVSPVTRSKQYLTSREILQSRVWSRFPPPSALTQAETLLLWENYTLQDL